MGACQTIDTAGQSAVFTPINGVLSTTGSAPMTDVLRNLNANLDANRPRMHHRADWGKWKGRPIALVAGGPSLKTTLNELRDIPTIMACGSSHDFLVREGFYPTYSVQADPDTTTSEFMTERPNGCQWLVASCCEAKVFDDLRDQSHFMWHSYGSAPDETFRGEPAIQGGCTVTLRAINIAIMLGYHDLHIFGLDSCFEDTDQQHAYPHGYVDPNVIRVKVGDGREFITNPTWTAQATQFQEMVRLCGHLFNPIIHGDGMIAEIMRQRENLK